MSDPIFLIGMPRSGTTWAAKVFDSHPGIAYRHEADTEYDLHIDLPLYPKPGETATLAPVVRDFVENRLAGQCSVRACGKRPLFRKHGDNFLSVPLRSLKLNMASIIERLLGRPLIWKNRLGDARLVWKSVESPARLGLFLSVYPKARGVYIIRDPCGYAASVLRGEKKMKFSDGQSLTESKTVFRRALETPFGTQLGMDLEEIWMLSKEARLALLWGLINQKTADDLSELDNGRIVRYEDLCRNPPGNYRQLFDFCGLDWAEQTNAFVASSTASENDAYYSVFKDPEKAAYKWKEELHPSQIESICEMAQRFPIGRAYFAKQPTDIDHLIFTPVETQAGQTCRSHRQP